MPRRSLFSPTERESLLAFPQEQDALIQHYTLNESDFAVINQRRGQHNRLGFAVQLCYLRYPGIALPPEAIPDELLLDFVCDQLDIDGGQWSLYARRSATRREHLRELQTWLGMTPFNLQQYRSSVKSLAVHAEQTDKGLVLVSILLGQLRQKKIILPTQDVIERVCVEALTLGTRRVYRALVSQLSAAHKELLDRLLFIRDSRNVTYMTWLRQPHGTPNAKHVLTHIERLNHMRDMRLPEGLEKAVHQNRLMKLAREGGQMTPQHLKDLEPLRRHATLTAVVLDTRATIIDELIDMHERILGAKFNKAKRQHADQFQRSGKDINDKLKIYSQIGRVLLEARLAGTDPFVAIEQVMSWDIFTESVSAAEKLSQPDFDHLTLVGGSYSQLRRYTPALLSSLELKATPAAQPLLDAVHLIQELNEKQSRKVPNDAPTAFIRKRWQPLVYKDGGLDRRFYEMCVITELKNSLRSGDIWLKHSRQFKNFDDYLIPQSVFFSQQIKHQLGLTIETDCSLFLAHKLEALRSELAKVEQLAQDDELPDAAVTASSLRIRPLTNAVPEKAEFLIRKVSALMPRLKITELLLEVDGWTGFSRHFTHLKSNQEATDKTLLLTAILADGINLGLTKMAESCPGITYSKLSWLQAWHIRDDTYTRGLAELTNAQHAHTFSSWWGDGTTSSSDGQRFKSGGRGEAIGKVNAKYGNEPGALFYTHISDHYAPFHTQVINATARDATYVLDGLLNHESDLRIEEHYTDTAGFTEHVFALMPILGFRFAPRIRDLADKRLYIAGERSQYSTLAGLIGGDINVKLIQAHWDEILRLATSIKQGTVTASLMLRKLGSYPRQNGLAVALRELGRIERTQFTLDWMQNTELRRRVQVGLNKGEAKNALARAVFFNRLGELRDRSFENQRYRASGLNLVVAAIILWNTVYIDRAIQKLRESGEKIEDDLLQHVSPLSWEHINLTGDYIWPAASTFDGNFRELRNSDKP
ncbi:MAG: Tn3 family transposase [Motiliproteus sp.]